MYTSRDDRECCFTAKPTSGNTKVWDQPEGGCAYRIQQREERSAGPGKVGVLVEGREFLAGRRGMQQVQLSWPRQHAPAGVLARSLELIQGCTTSTLSEAPSTAANALLLYAQARIDSMAAGASASLLYPELAAMVAQQMQR